MFPIHKNFGVTMAFFLFIYLFIYFLFCLTCQKVNCNKKALKILDHTYHNTSAEMFLFIYLFFLKYSTVEIILKENYFLKLGLDKLKVRTDQMFQAQA